MEQGCNTCMPFPRSWRPRCLKISCDRLLRDCVAVPNNMVCSPLTSASTQQSHDTSIHNMMFDLLLLAANKITTTVCCTRSAGSEPHSPPPRPTQRHQSRQERTAVSVLSRKRHLSRQEPTTVSVPPRRRMKRHTRAPFKARLSAISEESESSVHNDTAQLGKIRFLETPCPPKRYIWSKRFAQSPQPETAWTWPRRYTNSRKLATCCLSLQDVAVYVVKQTVICDMAARTQPRE